MADATRKISKALPDMVKRTLSLNISVIVAPETVLPSFINRPFTTARRVERSSCQAIPETLMSTVGGAVTDTPGLFADWAGGAETVLFLWPFLRKASSRSSCISRDTSGGSEATGLDTLGETTADRFFNAGLVAGD